jgi:SPP1 gp7 family putative phage head morphogenesis protein
MKISLDDLPVEDQAEIKATAERLEKEQSRKEKALLLLLLLWLSSNSLTIGSLPKLEKELFGEMKGAALPPPALLMLAIAARSLAGSVARSSLLATVEGAASKEEIAKAVTESVKKQIKTAAIASVFINNNFAKTTNNKEFKIWVALLDKRTCPRCSAMNGTVISKEKDFKFGNPPLHANCRCFTHYIK